MHVARLSACMHMHGSSSINNRNYNCKTRSITFSLRLFLARRSPCFQIARIARAIDSDPIYSDVSSRDLVTRKNGGRAGLVKSAETKISAVHRQEILNVSNGNIRMQSYVLFVSLINC